MKEEILYKSADEKYDITVIVPVFNTEEYLEECINSLVHQTKKNIEILIIDDGSTDHSLNIAKQIAETNNNITLVTQSNSGVCAARSLGIRIAKGTYIGWLDSDDVLKEEALEVIYTLMREKNADYGYYNVQFFPKAVPNKKPWFKKYDGVRDWNFIERNSQCTNTLTKKELLIKLDLPRLFLELNEYAWISVLLFAERIVYTEQKYYMYRVGHDSASGGTYKGKIPKFLNAAIISKKLDSIIIGTRYQEVLKDYFDYRYIYTLFMLMIVASVNRDKDVYGFSRKELNEVNYKKNNLVKLILDNNHGKLKSFVLRNVLPKSYYVSVFITNVVVK